MVALDNAMEHLFCFALQLMRKDFNLKRESFFLMPILLEPSQTNLC